MYQELLNKSVFISNIIIKGTNYKLLRGCRRKHEHSSGYPNSLFVLLAAIEFRFLEPVAATTRSTRNCD